MLQAYYNWILLGQTSCLNGETHTYALHTSPHKFLSVEECRIDKSCHNEIEMIYKDIIYQYRILCREPLENMDINRFAHDAIFAVCNERHKDYRPDHDNDDDDDDDHDCCKKKQKDKEAGLHKLKESMLFTTSYTHFFYDEEYNVNEATRGWHTPVVWELYRKADCNHDDHYILYQRSATSWADITDAVYDFADYFANMIACSQHVWKVLFFRLDYKFGHESFIVP